jgi:hypothetical protein
VSAKANGAAGAALLSFLVLGTALTGAPARAAAADGPLSFEQAFAASDERGPIHFQADFVSKKAQHRLEVWRDGATRLKRVTDTDVETYVSRRPGDSEFEMTVLDLRRKILTRIDRSNLYLTDWFDLAHGLRHPKGEYRLTRAQAPHGAPDPSESCSWYTLTQAARATHVCWSGRWQLPVTIMAQDGQVLWRLTEVDRRTIPAAQFVIDDRGFVRNDANQDIDRD